MRVIDSIESYRDALNAVFQQHGVILAYLYGSQARGDAGPLSDVDIAVLFAREMDKNEQFKHILELHGDLQTVFQRDDVYVMDLSEGTPVLNNNIRKQGRVLYCSDERARVEFVTHAFHRFVDTEPFRREQNKYLLEKIKRGMYGRSLLIERGK